MSLKTKLLKRKNKLVPLPKPHDVWIQELLDRILDKIHVEEESIKIEIAEILRKAHEEIQLKFGEMLEGIIKEKNETIKKVETLVDIDLKDNKKNLENSEGKLRGEIQERKKEFEDEKAISDSRTDSFQTDISELKKKEDRVIEGPPGPPGPSGPPGESIPSVSLESAKELAEKINTTEESLGFHVIKGLKQQFINIQRSIKDAKGGGGGGGMGNVQFKTFTGDGSTTTFTLDFDVTSSGGAIILLLNGQMQENGRHFTVSGRVITTTFTPATIDTLFAWYIR